MNMDDWPNCAIPGCPNKCCLRLSSKYCWPHTPGTPEEAKKTLDETELRKPEEVSPNTEVMPERSEHA